MYRILCWTSIFFCLGSIFIHLHLNFVFTILSEFAVWCIGIVLYLKKKLTLWLLLLLMISLFAGLIYEKLSEWHAETAWQTLMSQSVDKHQKLTVMGYVDGYIKSIGGRLELPLTVAYYLSSNSRHWMAAPYHPKIWLTIFRDQTSPAIAILPGDALCIPLRLKIPPTGGFTTSLLRKGIRLEASTSEADVQITASSMPVAPYAWQGLVQEWIESRATLSYGKVPTAFLLSFSIGDHMQMDSALVKIFVALGVVHAVVASGATIRMTVTPVVRMLMKIAPWRILWFSIGLSLTLLMMFLSAFSPPATRAALVYSYDLWGKFVRKKSDFYTRNAVSLVVLLLIQPEWLFDPGVIFSYAAAIAIHILPGVFSDTWFSHVRNQRIRRLLSKAFSLQFGVSPFVAFEFGQFPYLSLVVNLFLYPVLEWAIPISTVFIIVACVNPSGISMMSAFFTPFFFNVTSLLQRIGSLPLNYTFPPPPVWVQFTYLFLIAFSIWQIRRYKFRKVSKYSNG